MNKNFLLSGNQKVLPDPDLFKGFLEQFLCEEQPSEGKEEKAAKQPIQKKEASSKMEDLLAHANQLLFPFISVEKEEAESNLSPDKDFFSNAERIVSQTACTPQMNEPMNKSVNEEKELAVSFPAIKRESQEEVSVTHTREEEVDVALESIDVPLSNLTKFTKNSLSESPSIRFSEVISLKNQPSMPKEKKVFSIEGSKNSFFTKEENNFQEEPLQNELILKEKMDSTKPVELKDISFQSLLNPTGLNPVYQDTFVNKEQPILSKALITYVQPEQFIKEVGETIQLSIHSAPKETNQVVQVKLAPENLGKVEIHLEWQGNQVEAKIFVQEKNVRELLESQYTQLQQLIPKEASIQSITIAFLPPEAVSYQLSQDLGQKKAMQQPVKTSTTRSKREKKQIQKSSDYKVSRGLSLYM